MIDSRLTDAVETIGSIAEHDLSARECIKLASVLRSLAAFIDHTGRSKALRLGAQIARAGIEDAAAEAAYDRIPKPYQW